MRSLSLSILLAGCFACRGGEVVSERATELRLTRVPGGRIALELRDSPRNVCALQAELVVDSSGSFVLESAEPPPGTPLDSVRIGMREANRAILFAGDKRGVLLPRSGAVASFIARPSSATPSSGALGISSALASDCEGRSIDIHIGPSIAVE